MLGWFLDCFVLTFFARARMVDATARGWGGMLMVLARAHMVDAMTMLGWGWGGMLTYTSENQKQLLHPSSFR